MIPSRAVPANKPLTRCDLAVFLDRRLRPALGDRRDVEPAEVVLQVGNRRLFIAVNGPEVEPRRPVGLSAEPHTISP